MIRDRIQPVLDWLKRAVTRPREELTEWQTRARFAYDLGRYGVQQLKEDRAAHMAAALAFRTLFALLPVLVVSSVIFKGLRGVDRLKELVGDLIAGLGLDQVTVIPAEVPGEEAPEAVSLGAWLEQIVVQVGDLNLETLGWIGLAVMVYAAVAMMVTIENCFNAIYRAPEGRSWLRRLPTYWTVLTLGPLTIGLIFFFDNNVEEMIKATAVWPWVVTVLKSVWGIAVLWLFMLGVYMLIPHTQVAWKPAMIGAGVAAVLLQIGKVGLVAYISNALTLSYLYGTVGLVPILMLWVYVMWLCILFGLEVSATLQSLGGRRQLEETDRKRRRTGIVEPASILLVMEVIAERFQQSQPVAIRIIAEETSLPEPAVTMMIDRLTSAGLVHRLDRDDASVTLGCPPEQISADKLIEIGFSMVDESIGGRKSMILQKLRDVQKGIASEVTLAGLLGSKPVEPAVASSDQVSST
jgi:membrane protein